MKDSNQHIVFLTPGFPSSETDSTTIPALQVFLKRIKKALPLIKMTLISFQFPFISHNYIWNDIYVIPLNGKNKRYKKIWTWVKAYQLLKKIHKESPITFLHSFWIGECSLIGDFFAFKKNIPHLVTVMGQDAYSNTWFHKLLNNKHTTIVTLSEKHHKTLLKHHSLSSKIIPWGIEISNFPNLQQNTIDILGVGSLNKIKNYTLFIQLIAKLVPSFPNLKVELIGDGIEKSSIEFLIRTHHLQNHVQLLGKLSRDIVLQKMAQSRILLHTSSYESFGFVFIEALYSGMHIVSFPVGCSQKIPQWNIHHTSQEMLNTCHYLLSSSITKKRFLLSSMNNTINSYLKIYNA